jgi:alpha-tubulin suppressor-like RCC1 family protein
VAQVEIGRAHACALATDGSVSCWGEGEYGATGDGTTNDEHVPVPVTALGTTVAEVAAGGDHACAVELDGSLWCWGGNGDGQLGDGTTVKKSSPVQVTALGNSVAHVSAGAAHTCAVTTDGAVWCWGFNITGALGTGTHEDEHTPAEVTALEVPATTMSLGGTHSCALAADDSLWCWGANSNGQLGDGTSEERVLPVQVPLPACP